MKCFKNVFKADIRRFCNASWKFFAAFIVYCILKAVIFYTGAVKFIHKGIIDGVSFGDSMLYFFKGAKKFIIRGNTPMDIPIFGMLVVLYLLLIIALYINSDKNALGKSIIVASRSPVYWWISKCLIVVIAACVYMIIIHFLRREMLDFTAFPVFFVSNLLLVQRKKYYFNRAMVSRNCSIVL